MKNILKYTSVYILYIKKNISKYQYEEKCIGIALCISTVKKKIPFSCSFHFEIKNVHVFHIDSTHDVTFLIYVIFLWLYVIDVFAFLGDSRPLLLLLTKSVTGKNMFC